MSAHTPGPWKTTGDRKHPISPNVVWLDDDGACGDPECCGPAEAWVEIKQEDARLIAAAPDLLDACRLALSALRRLAPGEPDYIVSAIAKATSYD